jgi:hypothetical protein
MILTFSLDVQNWVGREMIFSIPYQLKLIFFTNLSDKNKLFWLLNCENQEILNSVGRFLYQNMPWSVLAVDDRHVAFCEYNGSVAAKTWPEVAHRSTALKTSTLTTTPPMQTILPCSWIPKFSDTIRPTIIKGLYRYENRNIASF